MRNAFAIVGLGFLILIIGIYFLTKQPTPSSEISDTSSSTVSIRMSTSTLTLTSSAFESNASIPSTYTCDGDQVNPPLTIRGVPDGTKSLALIMDDPDVPKQVKPDGIFDHWVLFNIPPETKDIAKGMTVGESGSNGAGNAEYTGPCPPSQYEPSEHRYFFKLYALATMLSLPVGASKADVEKAMQGHILAETQLIGRYKRR